jgi:galactitol-specific phosphotransferase system IIB component
MICNLKKRFIICIIILLLINGCSRINQNQAEAKALEFVNKNVKFFAREENTKIDLPKYNIDSLSSYQKDSDWIVIIHVSASIDNKTKKNDLIVKVDKRGKVIEFNGVKVDRD